MFVVVVDLCSQVDVMSDDWYKNGLKYFDSPLMVL
jgi:hypothetical protein